jgi:hypothetical protein
MRTVRGNRVKKKTGVTVEAGSSTQMGPPVESLPAGRKVGAVRGLKGY